MDQENGKETREEPWHFCLVECRIEKYKEELRVDSGTDLNSVLED